jgi:serine protease Do
MIEGMNTGIGFAIPVNLAKRVMTHLIEEGKYARSWLGIKISDLRDDADYQTLDSKLAPDAQDGVIVTEIIRNGPAAKSDLQPGDVITAVDQKIIKTSRQLKDEIEVEKPGHVIVLNVVRARQHLPIKVTAALLPSEPEVDANAESSRPQTEAPSLGLTVEAMSKDAASQYGIDQTPGVIVTAVEEDSPAQDRGIQAGDVITEINRKRITTPHQFREALKAADKKAGMMINLISSGASRVVVLRADGE